jgi:c-di-GMP-binding flagellar brake protein YcgR
MQMQQFLEALRDYRASTTDILMVLLGLTALVVYLVYRNRWQRAMALHLKKRRARADFLAGCRERSLLKEEITLLATGAGPFDPEVALGLLQSNVSFDRFARDLMLRANIDQITRLNSILTGIRGKLGFRPPPRGLSLVSSRELSHGQFVYLVFPNDQFLEAIVDEVDETKLVVTVIGRIPHRLPMFSGSPVMIHLNRAGDARYAGSAFILKSSSDEEEVYLTLSHADDLRRDQRRRDFRVDENRAICLWVMDGSQDSVDDRSRIEDMIPERASLDDISGGGASLIYQRELPVNQRLYVNLDPSQTYGLPLVKATVIRSTRRSGLSSWGISVRFDDLRPSERQCIVRHVFMQEREYLKAV